MGDVPSKYDEPLQPQPQPLWALERRFCVPQPVTLRLREKFLSFSGDDFKISDANTGQPWFQMSGKVFSLREKKTLLDINGAAVCNMKETLLNFFEPNYRVFRGSNSDEELFKITARFTFAKAKAYTPIVNGENGQPLTLVLKGDFLSKAAMIFIGEPKQGGIPVAKIYRPTTGRSILGGVNDYFLEVAPNVDVALCVVICVCLDEMKKDNNRD